MKRLFYITALMTFILTSANSAYAYYWTATYSHTCSATVCGTTGTEPRTSLQCNTSTGQVGNYQCNLAGIPKPPLTRTCNASCNTPPPVTYSWTPNGFGTCSATQCGTTGTQSELFVCKRSDGVTVADLNCTSAKPSIAQSCSASSCNPPPPPVSSGTCIPGDTRGDLAPYGYTRQCSGSIRSMNATLHPTWNNQFSGLMSGAWPGSIAQAGFGLIVNVNQYQYASFEFNTGSTVTRGVHIESNPSFGWSGIWSVSTSPGDFFPGSTAICMGSVINMSAKSPTLATCKLQLNQTYYLNLSSADYFAPHGPVCETLPCSTGWGVYSYGN